MACQLNVVPTTCAKQAMRFIVIGYLFGHDEHGELMDTSMLHDIITCRPTELSALLEYKLGTACVNEARWCSSASVHKEWQSGTHSLHHGSYTICADMLPIHSPMNNSTS